MFSVVKSPYSGRGLDLYRDINNERDYLGVEASLEFVRDSGKTPYLAEIVGFSKEYRYERRFLGSPSADIMTCHWRIFYPLEGLLWDRPVLIEARAYGRVHTVLYRDLTGAPVVYPITEATLRDLLRWKIEAEVLDARLSFFPIEWSTPKLGVSYEIIYDPAAQPQGIIEPKSQKWDRRKARVPQPRPKPSAPEPCRPAIISASGRRISFEDE